MSVSHLYKDFGSVPFDQNSAANAAGEEVEEAKLQSFEDGYQSGWDDAVAAQESTKKTIGAAFAQNLQDVSFSFHEARGTLAKQLREVMEPMLDSLLPELARQSLAHHILEQTQNLSRESLDRPLEIAVSPMRATALQALCEADLKEPFVLVPDETLAEDQVFIRVGELEREIDFDGWFEEVRQAVSAFFDKVETEATNG